MYNMIQVVLIVTGAMLIIKGVVNIAKGYNVDKLLSMFLNKELPKTNQEKEK